MRYVSSAQDFCGLLEKINKVKGTDKKRKLFTTFLKQWRQVHKRLHPSSDANPSVSHGHYIHSHLESYWSYSGSHLVILEVQWLTLRVILELQWLTLRVILELQWLTL